jgi:hypothetical protein
VELIIAGNPDPDSTLPYLVRVPISGGLVFRTKGTWPRTSALYCHPVPASEWPDAPEVVERIPLQACSRRGAAIDLVAQRAREKRSQIVFTRARGRDMVFWQSPRTRKQARPDVRLPTARAAQLTEMEIVVDSHEQYAYRFGAQQARTVTRALPCGDYAVTVAGKLIASVERKSLRDLVASLTSGRLRFALAELATLPRAAVVVMTDGDAALLVSMSAASIDRHLAGRAGQTVPPGTLTDQARHVAQVTDPDPHLGPVEREYERIRSGNRYLRAEAAWRSCAQFGRSPTSSSALGRIGAPSGLQLPLSLRKGYHRPD